MYADRYMMGRFWAIGRAKVLLKNETECILNDVYMEGIAPFDETYNLVTDYEGFWWFDMGDIDPEDIDFVEHENYEIEKVLEIIKADWELKEEWERESCFEKEYV